jgi:hypothetical protein
MPGGDRAVADGRDANAIAIRLVADSVQVALLAGKARSIDLVQPREARA